MLPAGVGPRIGIKGQGWYKLVLHYYDFRLLHKHLRLEDFDIISLASTGMQCNGVEVHRKAIEIEQRALQREDLDCNMDA
jgi:hypothetical protein